MRDVLVGVALLFGCTQAFAAEPQNPQADLERKLLGEWDGGSCMGDYTFYPDGTFEVHRFTPGGNILTGTWSLKSETVPPTLALTCKTSDFKKRYSDRSEYAYLGKTLELKVLELNDDTFVFQHPDHKGVNHHTRAEKAEVRELAALQGTWVPLQYEARGHQIEPTRRHIVKGDKITVQVDGKTLAEGRIVLDATKNPKQLDIQFASGEKDSMIYARTNNYLICCGNQGDETRPREFVSGTAKGGDYLVAWKIEK